MSEFQITETRKCKPGDCPTDACHPGTTGEGTRLDRACSSGSQVSHPEIPGADALLCRSPNSRRKKYMISYEEEIKRFKPSLDVDQIEDAIAKVDLTDMNDIMTSLIEEAIKHKKDESAK